MEFLGQWKGMIASQTGHNILVEQVLRLLHYLVKFGYYGNARDIQELQEPLLNLLDGKLDLPFVPEVDKGKTVTGMLMCTAFYTLHLQNVMNGFCIGMFRFHIEYRVLCYMIFHDIAKANI